MRLNKEPPDDIPVVEFVGLAGTPTSAAISPRVGRAGGDAGAGMSPPTAPTAPTAPPAVGTREEDEDLIRIKNSRELTEDDNCVVCLSGELGAGKTGRGTGLGGGG